VEVVLLKTMSRVLTILLLSICLAYLSSNAQIIKPAEFNEHDTELWTDIGIDHKINKRWNVGLAQSYRHNGNLQNFKSTFTQFDVEYRYKKDIRFSAAIRYIYRGISRHSLRPLLNFALVHRAEKVNLKNRLRFQQDFEDLETGEMLSPDLDFYLRNKVTVTFKKVDVIEPFIFGEIFYRVHYRGNEFDQMRLGAGFSKKLTKRQDLSLVYVYREEFNVRSPLQSHVISAGLSFELKKFPKFGTAPKKKSAYH